MNFKKKISLITHSCATIGVVETFKALARYALRPEIEDSNYDKQNSTDTASPIDNKKLEMSDPEAQRKATQPFIARHQNDLSATS
jgi:hypothetical protein